MSTNDANRGPHQNGKCPVIALRSSLLGAWNLYDPAPPQPESLGAVRAMRGSVAPARRVALPPREWPVMAILSLAT